MVLKILDREEACKCDFQAVLDMDNAPQGLFLKIWHVFCYKF